MKRTITLLILATMALGFSIPESGYPCRKGQYLGQICPDTLPELFAPGVVSTAMFTRDMAISPDGKEIYFSVSVGSYTYATILFSRLGKDGWSEPEIVPFSGGPGVMDMEPAFASDGQRLYFLSNRATGDGPAGNQDIWYVERRGDLWSEAQNLGAPVNTDGGEFFPSLTRDGTLYFSRNEKGSALNQIFRSTYMDGSFSEPELLPDAVNCGSNRFNAFISPEEDYLIVPVAGMEDAFDGVDYYIVFREKDDRWSEPVNMGPLVNKGNSRGWSPYVSPDKQAFFFMSNKARELGPEDWNYQTLKALYGQAMNGKSNVWWMEAGFIEKLKSSAVFPD